MRLVLVLILLVALVDVSLQYSAIDGLKACLISTDGYALGRDPPITYRFRGFNDGEWRVKELRLYYGNNMLGRFFWGGINQTPGSVDNAPGDGQALTTFEFVYVDGTVECFTATVPWYYADYDHATHTRYNCPKDVSRSICPTHPLYVLPTGCSTSAGCTSDPNSMSQWQCNNGLCLHQYKDARCQDLYADTTVQLQTQPNSLILTGFRLSDCWRNPVITDATNLVIVENDLLLMPVETKANMTQMRDSVNFVQLMVGMCPRTLVVLDEVIEGLHSFVNTSNMETTFIALSAFDGAKDFVSLLSFTQNTSAIHAAIDNLRNYNQRDSSCNIKQSALSMLRTFKASTLGQPWDRKFLVIFSASIDITNFVPDFDVSVEFSTDREVFTFFIGMSIPQSQWPVLSAIGNAGYFTLARETAINRHYVYVAKVAKSSYLNEYVLGYCSPSRTNKINTKLSMTLSSNNQAYIQQFPFDAAGFGGKCSTVDVISELCDCATYDANSIKHGAVLCYNCYKSSFAISGSNSQALLRYPIGDALVLRLNFTTHSTVAPFDVYLRKGGVSTAWLYDTVISAVTLTQLPLDGFVAGDLVGVYFDFKGNAYDVDLLIGDQTITAPPVGINPPVATIPVAPPVTIVAPVASPFDPFNTPVAPPRQDPLAPSVTPVNPVTPLATPTSPPLTVPPVAKIPVAMAPSTNATEEEASGAGSVVVSLAVINALVLAGVMVL